MGVVPSFLPIAPPIGGEVHARPSDAEPSCGFFGGGAVARRGRATGTPRSGFTLVEILVAVTIIAILAGVVVVNFVDSAGQRRVQAEAERLALAVELARGESVRRNEVWGLNIDNGQYGFVRHDAGSGRWEEVEEPEFRPHGAEVILRLEGSAARRQPNGPEVAIFPNGETTPFAMLVLPAAGEGAAWHVSTDGIGRTLVRPANEIPAAATSP